MDEDKHTAKQTPCQDRGSQGFEDFLRWERASRDTIDFKVCYVDMAGDLLTGLLLSQIIYWHLPSKTGGSKLIVERDGYRWLAKMHGSWHDEIRMSRKQVVRALGILKDKGLIETESWRFNGLRTTHIRIVPEKFLEAWKVATVIPQEAFRSSLKGTTESTQRARPITETFTETTEETVSQSGQTPSVHGEDNDNGLREALANRLGIEDPALSELALREDITESVIDAWVCYLRDHPEYGPGLAITFLRRGGSAIWPPAGRHSQRAMPGDKSPPAEDYRTVGGKNCQAGVARIIAANRAAQAAEVAP